MVIYRNIFHKKYWRENMFKKIMFSDVISTLLSSAIGIYIYWYAYDISGNQFAISLIGASQLFAIFLSTVGGGLTDKFNKVTFIKCVILAKVSISLIVLVIDSMGVNLIISLMIYMFVTTVLNSLISPTMEAIVPILSKDEEELYRLNAWVNSYTQIFNIIGILLSAVFVAFFAFNHIVWIAVVLNLIAFVTIYKVELNEKENRNTENVLSNIKSGIKYIMDTSYIKNLIPIALIMNFCFWSISLLLPKISIDSFGFLDSSYSFLKLFFALGGIAGGLYFAKYSETWKNKFKLFYSCLFLQSIFLVLIGINLRVFDGMLSYSLLLILWGSYAVVNTVMSIVYFGSIQKSVPEYIIGSVIGSILTIFSLVNPLAAIASGYLTKFMSASTLIIVFSLLMLITSLLTVRVKDLNKAF